MKKTSLVITLSGVAVAGLMTGIFLTAKFDLNTPARAVEVIKEGQPLAVPSTLPPAQVQPAAFFGTPSFVDLAKKVGPAVVNISTTKNPPKRPQMPNRRQFGPQGPGGQGQDPFDDFLNIFSRPWL
ncbi:MAG: hypothetical protein IPJ69_08750 [Deltaproteobacteria bacterium]|nr:MAG: hypothetical protein IPJ69_08750 [Deltaproteobacteria bacterium]